MLRTLLEIPLVWFVAAFSAGWLLMRRAAWAQWFAAADGASCIGILLVVSALNVRSAGFLVSFGANVLGIAAAHRHGQAMYHAVGGPQLYSLIYGPYTYLVYEPFLSGMHSLTAVKLELFILDAVTLASIFVLLRRHTAWPSALALTGVGAAMLLVVPAGVLGIRGDMWVVLAFTLALLAIDAENWLVASLVTGLCSGFAIDVKATLALEAMLLLAMLWRRRGSKAAVAGFIAAAAIAAAPFNSAGISWSNYFAWLKLSGQRETFTALLIANSLYAILLLLPAALLWNRNRIGSLPEVILFTLALLSAIVLGAKSGGGLWHLWPLLPFVLAWSARRLDRCDNHRLVSALALAALVVSARWGFRAVRTELPRITQAARSTESEEQKELTALAEANPETRVELAPGATMTSDAEDLRFFLVAYGEPYAVDMVAAGEALKTDAALLDHLVPTVGNCGTFWAVPHGEVPFSTLNNSETRMAYPQLFPQPVRAAFLAGHHLVQQGSHYDLWATASKSQSIRCE